MEMDRVQQFTPDGRKLLNVFGHSGTGPGEFDRAEGMGMDAADRLYVADSCNHRIQVFSDDGKWLRQYGSAGSGPGQFSYPYDIRIDEQGRQYVCEFGNSRIQVFDANDKPLETIGGPAQRPASSAIPGALPSIPRAICMWRIRRTIACKNSSAAIPPNPLSPANPPAPTPNKAFDQAPRQ